MEDTCIDELEPDEVTITDLLPANKRSEAFCLVRWIVSFLSFLQAVYHISDAVTLLWIKFLHILFNILGRFCSICRDISVALPKSLRLMHKFTGCSNFDFKRYIVCKKCHQIYSFSQCLQQDRKCNFQAYPCHPFQSIRQPCNSLLLKTVEFASGKTIFYPFKTYCYMNLVSSFERLLERPSFYSLCEEWRSRPQTDLMNDIYDGEIWKDFQNFDGKPFLSEPFSFGFMINVDWFQPFKHTQYSVGAIYMTILNLPRHIRNKPSNILLIGLLPGPHEPPLNMNSYIDPLVKELETLWVGKEMNVHGFSSKQVVRCALLCAACDLPAGRKLCGFLSYNACYGCTRCWKKFPGGVGSRDFSGFDRNNWPIRNEEEHRNYGNMLLSCTTKAQKSKIEKDTGYRYTSLLRLPYFNPTRMLILDPMHNFFLGTAKHVLKSIWIDLCIIKPEDFTSIQSRIDRSNVPSDMGRIPHKIMSGFSSFTADQYKNWVLYFSLLSLKDNLHGDDRECWRHFVLACRLLCRKSISVDNIKLADALLLQFCRRIERLYGKHLVRPNMHLHAHMKECVEDYGPLHGFWLFAFERFNGILGHQPNNNRSIETQLMSRFVRDNHHISMPLPDQYDEFTNIFSHDRPVVGTLSDCHNFVLPLSHVVVQDIKDWSIHSLPYVLLPPHSTRGTFSVAVCEELKKLYFKLYDTPIVVNSSYIKYRSISMYGKQVGSHNSRSRNSSVVMCQCDSFFPASSITGPDRPARINYFAKHSVLVHEKLRTHLLFSASFFKIHPRRTDLGQPLSIWECDIFESSGISLLPVQFIKCRTVSLVDFLNDSYGNVLFVVPCVNF